MASDLNVVYRISADIAGLKDGVAKAQQSTAGLEKSAQSLGTAFDSSFKKIADSSERGIGTVTAELLLAQKEVKNLQTLVLKNADKPGFVAGLGYELDAAIPKVNALERELKGLQTGLDGAGSKFKGATDSGKEFSGWLTQGTAVLGAFGVSLGIGGLVAFGKSLLDTAGEIQDLHEATGVSREGLQRLAFVGSDVGVSMEQMGKAAGNLSDKLASGDKSASEAVAKLGLNIKDLIAAGPEEAFIQVAEAAGRIEDPMTKVALVSDLFGAQLGKKLIPLLGELRTKLNEIPEKDIIKDSDIENADALGDAIGRATIKLKAWTFQLLSLPNNMGIGGGSNLDLMGMPRNLSQNRVTEDIPLGPTAAKETISNADLIANKLNQLRADAMEPLTAATKAQILELKKWGESESDIAKLVGHSESSVHLYIEAHKEAEQQITKTAAANKKYLQEVGALNKAIAGDFATMMKDQQRQLKLTNERTVDLVAAFTHLRDIQHEAFGTSHAFLEGIEKVGQSVKVTDDEISRALALHGTYGPSLDQLAKTSEHFGKSFTMGFQKGIHDLPAVILSTIEGGGNVAVAIGSTFGKSVGDSINASLQKSIKESARGPAAKSLLSGLSDLIPVAGALLGPLLGKLFSIGGPSKDELAGRDVVQSFEAQFKGTEDMINQIGAAYIANGKSAEDAQMAIQKLWAAEKQGAEATKAALEEINAELQHHKEVTDAIHSQGFQSQDEIRHAADIANQAYEEMLKSGQYTADQVDKAYRHYQELLAQLEGAAGDAARAWLKAHQAADGAAKASSDAMKSAEDDLKALIDKRDALAKGIAAEAPEAVMGVIETQQRAELEALDGEIQRKADDYAKLAKETGQEMADAIVEALKRIHVTIDVGYNLPNIPGGQGVPPGTYDPGGVGSDTTAGAARGGLVRSWGIQHFAMGGIVGRDSVPTMLTPGEMVLTHDQQTWVGEMLGGGNQPIQVTVQSVLDGQIIAESTVVKMAQDKRGLRTKTRRALGVS